jgi:F-type H+-transporting ATPase subunit delta
MPHPRLAARYAKALLELAIETKQLEQVHEDMLWLKAALKESRDFLNLLRSPIIKTDVKLKALKAVTEKKLSALTQQFNTLLVQKNREAVLPEIAIAFDEQYKEYKGIHSATLTTAIPVTDQTKNALIQKVKQESGFQHILLEEKVDPSILGGFVLQMGDTLIDASIAHSLKEVSQQFKKNDFVYKMR